MQRPLTAWKLKEAEWRVGSLFYCFLAPKSRFDFVSFLIVENTHPVPSVLLLRLKKKDHHLLILTFLIYFKKILSMCYFVCTYIFPSVTVAVKHWGSAAIRCWRTTVLVFTCDCQCQLLLWDVDQWSPSAGPLLWFEWEWTPKVTGLNTWSPVGKTVWEGLGDVDLSKEGCHSKAGQHSGGTLKF